MSSLCAVIFTGAINIFLRICSFNIHPDTESKLGQWLFLISVLMLLLDHNAVPVTYKFHSKVIQFLIKTFIILTITQLSTIILWSNLEKVISIVIKSIFSTNSNVNGKKLAEFIMNMIGLILIFKSASNNQYQMLKQDYNAWKSSLKRFEKTLKC